MKNTREIKIIIGDKERRLRFKYRGLLWFKDKYGVSLTKFFGEDGSIAADDIDEIDLLINIVYAGLIYDNPDLSIEDVQDSFDLSDLVTWMKIIAEAWTISMPEPAEGKAPTKAKAKS